jgi:SAM-dependent methyltransferase
MTHATDRQAHWEGVYRARAPTEVSWYQDTPKSSLELIEHANVGVEAPILDVGGGGSRLVDHLLRRGYENVTVLDISERALEVLRERLGKRADDVRFIRGDVTEVELEDTFVLWHDRAVFHFLTDPKDRERYRELLLRALRPGGHAIVATFAPDGPEKCSGLDVARYSPEGLASELGAQLELVETWDEDHVTPAGVTQRFVFCRFRRLAPETN